MRHHQRTAGPGRRGTGVVVAALMAVAALLFGATGPAADSTSSNSAVEGKTFVIGTDTTFAPFEFRDSSGELTGIDIDILKAIAEDQGFNVQIRSLGFNAALQALSSDQVDGVIGGKRAEALRDALELEFHGWAPSLLMRGRVGPPGPPRPRRLTCAVSSSAGWARRS